MYHCNDALQAANAAGLPLPGAGTSPVWHRHEAHSLVVGLPIVAGDGRFHSEQTASGAAPLDTPFGVH
jgi:hypothetical protein